MDERSSGNGSIMRLAPVPMRYVKLFPNSIDELGRVATPCTTARLAEPRSLKRFVYAAAVARAPKPLQLRQHLRPLLGRVLRIVLAGERAATDPATVQFWVGRRTRTGFNDAGCESFSKSLFGHRGADRSPAARAGLCGHQFGGFVPQLGDGRALLLGQVIDRRGLRRDIALKGSGRTPFSRGGDGKAAVGPVLREYLIGEAMHALGIPTTRALAAVGTGESVRRSQSLPGAVLTRVAASHVRVGTFQFFAARGDYEKVRALADYVIAPTRTSTAGSSRPLPRTATICCGTSSGTPCPMDDHRLHPRGDEHG